MAPRSLYHSTTAELTAGSSGNTRVSVASSAHRGNVVALHLEREAQGIKRLVFRRLTDRQTARQRAHVIALAEISLVITMWRNVMSSGRAIRKTGIRAITAVIASSSAEPKARV